MNASLESSCNVRLLNTHKDKLFVVVVVFFKAKVSYFPHCFVVVMNKPFSLLSQPIKSDSKYYLGLVGNE